MFGWNLRTIDKTFVKRILFTDEATFTLNVNKLNSPSNKLCVVSHGRQKSPLIF